MAKSKEPTKTKAKKAVTLKPKTAGKPKTAKTTSKKIDPTIIRFCSFCEKPSDSARRLIAGPKDIFICDECIMVCNCIFLQDDIKFWGVELLKALERELSGETEKYFAEKREAAKKKGKK